jgi:hypothetical protein
MSWTAHWDDSVAKDRPSRVSYELFAAGSSTTKLHLVHDDFDGPNRDLCGVGRGLAPHDVFTEESPRNWKTVRHKLMEQPDDYCRFMLWLSSMAGALYNPGLDEVGWGMTQLGHA